MICSYCRYSLIVTVIHKRVHQVINKQTTYPTFGPVFILCTFMLAYSYYISYTVVIMQSR